MRKNQIKTYQLRKRTTSKNLEGGSVTTWAEAIPIEAIIWHASGAVAAQMYGERLAYIKNMEYSGTEDLQENDGICVYVVGTEVPDYRIKSINRDVDPLVIVLEKYDGK